MADDEVMPGHGEEETGAGGRYTFASKLNRLFEIMHPAGERPPSNAKVATSITEQYGVDISHNYLWMLRNGQRTNPTMRHVQALAWFFGIDPSYFFDNDKARQIDAELDLAAALRDAGVRDVALRTSRVSGATRSAIEHFVAHAAQLEEQHQDPHRDQGRSPPEEYG